MWQELRSRSCLARPATPASSSLRSVFTQGILVTRLNRDFGRTEPFESPRWTDAQHADITLALKAAKRADALHDAATHYRNAFHASCVGDERSAALSRAEALAALHMHPAIRADLCGGVHPVITRHDEARAIEQQILDLLDRVRHSTLGGTARATRMDIALEAVTEDLRELEAGR
jgi:hypothetical protein